MLPFFCRAFLPLIAATPFSEVLIDYMFQTLLHGIFFSSLVMFSHPAQLRVDLCCNWQVELCKFLNNFYYQLR